MKTRGTRSRNILLILLVVLATVLGWQMLMDRFSDEERQWRSELRNGLIRQFPEQARQVQSRYGLRPFPGTLPLHAQSSQVVLVHGLDDPGRVWMNMAPALAAAGFGVWIMSYPDDQPIEESAALLAGELVALSARGVTKIDMVAHSMGGLVSREMLTHPSWTTRQGPRVGQLIMLGTPNHGSQMARFRLLGEWRDQLAELLNGEFHWLGWVVDGAGEAGIDLIPESRFLQRLNARPPPVNVRLTVVAAVLGKLEQQRLLALLPALHGDSSAVLDRALQTWDELSEGVGDGLVSVESARLPGAAFHLLEGSHLSMVRNLLPSSQRVPPAVPLVLSLLRGQAQTVTSMP
jgi:pimeloyl-ACP methyl ester carboxylesterase